MRKKKVRRYTAGGKVSGPGTKTSDSILARLSKGEYVLPAESVAQVGLPTLESIRRQGLATRALQAGTKGGADLLGVGTGIGGFIKGMTHSPDANAAVQDQLLTDEYRNAQAAIQQGRGQQYPYPPIYGLIGPSPELPVDTVARMQGEQWRADQGGALGTPTHQRKLAEMNQYNPGSMGLPRYAEGGRVGKAEWNRLPRFAGGGSPLELVDDPYRQWKASQQAAAAARQAAETSQKRIPLRGGSPTRGLESPAEILQPKTAAIPSPRFSTTPPLPTATPRGQMELPSMPSGPASKAPIPFDVRPIAHQPLALEPKGLPLPNEIPYVSPKQSGLSLAPGNVIDYQAPVPPPSRQFANFPTTMTPSQIAALKQQAELVASQSMISPQEAIKNMEAMRLEPIEKQPMQARQPINPAGHVSTASIVGRTLPLAGENIAPALGMVGNIANNVFSGMGLPDAIKLGYDQARFDEMTSEGRKQYFNDVRPIAPKSADSIASLTTPVVPTAQQQPYWQTPATSVPATPGNEWGSLQDKWGIERPRPGTLPAPSTAVPQAKPAAPSTAVPQAKPAAPSTAVPIGIYQDPRDYLAQNPDASGGAMRASGAAQLPGTDIYRRTTAAPGFGSDNPNRIPGPGQIAGTTTYTPLGVSAIGGGQGTATFQGLPKAGGTLSVIDQGNGGTVEGNVAAINRQTEALRSLREAQNPGITTGQAGRAFGDLVSIGTPGGNFGDEAMQRQKVLGMLTDAGRPGVTKARRLALLEGAQQMAGLPQPPGATRLPGEQGVADPYKMALLQLDANKFGLDQQRFGLDQNKARQEEALKQQQMALDAHFKLPKDAQETRMNQLQGAYYDAAMKSGPESPEAQKLAAIINLINKARPALDLNALMQQK